VVEEKIAYREEIGEGGVRIFGCSQEAKAALEVCDVGLVEGGEGVHKVAKDGGGAESSCGGGGEAVDEVLVVEEGGLNV
jgi:hypothetical protein